MRSKPTSNRRQAPHQLTSVITSLMLLCALSAPESAHALDAADAHLFTDAAHAAAGTCFPKYHLELWDQNVPHDLSDRQSGGDQAGPQCDSKLFRWNELRAYFRTSHRSAPNASVKWAPPRLAVTLEGGGSKSAPFSLGALAGLHASGLLSEVDIISSVSGGSYAAYFYFSRLLDAQRNDSVTGVRDPNAWFRDCTPSLYHRRFTEAAAARQLFCTRGHIRDDEISAFARDFPYQAHVRFYQDLVHWKGGLERVNQNRSDAAWTYTNVGLQLVQHIATAPLHFLMNSVFAMPESTSPSRFAYRAGIERAYGHTMSSWAGASSSLTEPSGGDFSARVYQRQFAMSDLAPLVGADPCAATGISCKGPLWIANAAASSGRDLTNWVTVPANDALRANFEMTPFGQGSGIYGFVNRPVSMPLRDVVGSSAAFLDRDQREFGLGALRVAAGSAISLLNLEWGSDIPNYNSNDDARARAHLTPFPLYHVPNAQQRFSPTIHLADGGNTDNLGVLAALRRGSQNIVVVAATGDGRGRLASLCRAKNHLELDGTYRVEMPQLIDVDRLCSGQIGQRELAVWGEAAITDLVCKRRPTSEFCIERDGAPHWDPTIKSTLGYDMWNWPIPILSGRVIRDVPQTSEVKLISNIYLVKPAIYQPAALMQFENAAHASPPVRLCDLDYSFQVKRCSVPVERRTDRFGIKQEDALPCTSLAFAAANACHSNTDHGVFPQHDVVFTTLNSSYTLFGAYYDLARHVTSQIGLSRDGQSLLVPEPINKKQIRLIGTERSSTTSVSLYETAN